MKATLILGAGFSKNSGIPVQQEIPELLIKEASDSEFEHAVSSVIKRFLKDIFGWTGTKNLPNLDDVFTCIDISTNSGHHLGIKYSPMELRTIRRLLIYRLFSILDRYFTYSEDVEALLNHYGEYLHETAFVVLNWDTVLERYLKLLSPHIKIDYCNGGRSWGDSDSEETREEVKVLKLHGSDNWLYCDNCRALFYDLDCHNSTLQKAGFEQSDLELFDELKAIKMLNGEGTDIECKLCTNKVSSHIATFSYRKSFRANSFPDIWKEAEKTLSDSERWVFIGYSLPDADYEFKHLLKIAQLKLQHKKSERVKIDVVLLNSTNTIDKYNKFFGNSIGNIYNGGIESYLKSLKAESNI